MTNDGDLLRSYGKTGDEAAFAELVARHVAMLHGAATRLLGDAHAAHDAVQWVFVLLARDAHRLCGHPCLAGWLHLALVNRVRDLRKAGIRQRRRERTVALMNQDDDVHAQRLWENMRPVIDEALAALRPDERAVIVLRFFEGHSLAEVSAKLHTTEDAARMRVQRALARLGSRLRRAGITSVASATLLSDALAAGAATAPAPAGLAGSVSAAALTEIGAITSTAATASAVAGLGTLMALIKTTGLGIAAAAAVGWATWEHRALNAATARSAAAKTARAVSAPLVAAATTLPLAPASTPQTRKSAGQREAEAKARGDALLAAHPELRNALDDHKRARVLSENRRFLATYSLTAEQRAEFEAIMVANTSGGHTLSGEKEDDKVTFSSPKVIDNRERDRRLQALLGEAGFNTWQRAGGTSWQDRYLRKVIGALADSETPLTPEEAGRLRQTLTNSLGPSAKTLSSAWDNVMMATVDLSPAARDALGALRASDLLVEADAAAAKAELEKANRRP
jgi:RNA polymerase sigma factor (sigma-70 family)